MLFIDELQDVEEDELAALITSLHRTAQHQLPVTHVGAGLPQLRGRMGRVKSYAERSCDFPQIGALLPSAAKFAISKPAADQGVKINENALERILEETRGYAYFLQQCGKHVWDVADASPITRHDVERASRITISALDESFFRMRFDRLTPAEKKYRAAVRRIHSENHAG